MWLIGICYLRPETESLHKKVLRLEIDVDDLKKSSNIHRENAKPHSPKSIVKKCSEFEQAFTKNSDLIYIYLYLI